MDVNTRRRSNSQEGALYAHGLERDGNLDVDGAPSSTLTALSLADAGAGSTDSALAAAFFAVARCMNFKLRVPSDSAPMAGKSVLSTWPGSAR